MHGSRGQRRPEFRKPALFSPRSSNLTKEQLEQVLSVRDRFRTQMFAIRNDLKAKQLGLIDLLAAQNVNSGAVNSSQEEIQVLQQRMQATIIAHITEEAKIFTAEQRGSFFRIMKERIDQQCLPLIRPLWGNKPAE
ncbi:MAG: Spy/CpxP family protein refolding chaperone [Syntrophobacteraceae bacterium]